jgi:hypothetical protein
LFHQKKENIFLGVLLANFLWLIFDFYEFKKTLSNDREPFFDNKKPQIDVIES